MFMGYPPLTSGYIEPELPLIGPVTIPSALLFGAGVYAIVIGLAMHILHSLGGQLDLEEDERKERARDRARALQRKNEQRRAAREETLAQREREREAEKQKKAETSRGGGEERSEGRPHASISGKEL